MTEYYALWITRNGQHLWSGPHYSWRDAACNLDQTMGCYGHRIVGKSSVAEISDGEKDLTKIVSSPEATMLYIGGSKTSFKCNCGGNVFTELFEGIYRCNSCTTEYRGE